MMKARYGVDRDVAVSDKKRVKFLWGQRGSIGDECIKRRIEFVVDRILPDYAEALDTIQALSSPIQLDTNLTWTDSINVPNSNNQTSSIAKELANDSASQSSAKRNYILLDGRTPHTARKFIY